MSRETQIRSIILLLLFFSIQLICIIDLQQNIKDMHKKAKTYLFVDVNDFP
jgi:hypothetical protein